MTRHKLDVDAWSDYSESMSAGWLSLPEDDKLLFDLTYKFLHSYGFTQVRGVDDNWISLLREYEHLIGSKYLDDNGKIWTFSGLLHGKDDYYFVMQYPNNVCCYISCVGHIEMAGFKLHEAVVRDDDG